MTSPPSTPPSLSNNNDERNGAPLQDCPWHPGQHTRHNCTLNPEGPNWQVPQPKVEGTAAGGTHPAPTTNNPQTASATPNSPKYVAANQSGLPQGKGTSASYLDAYQRLPNQRAPTRSTGSGRGHAPGRGGRGPGGRGKPPPIIHPHRTGMSKSAGNATAILLGRSSPAYPTINFQSLYYSGLSEFEKTYVMISVVASQMYGHSNKEINAHHAGHYWHDFGSGDFIHLLKNLDTAVAEFKQSPCYPFFPAPNRMYLSPEASKFVNSSIPQISSNNEDEQTADSYKRIELFLQRYMANHWSVFMTALAKSEPTLTELQKLVTKKGALFIKATTLQLHYSYTIPTTRLYPPQALCDRKPNNPLINHKH
jgi:hypothetical protein